MDLDVRNKGFDRPLRSLDGHSICECHREHTSPETDRNGEDDHDTSKLVSPDISPGDDNQHSFKAALLLGPHFF